MQRRDATRIVEMLVQDQLVHRGHTTGESKCVSYFDISSYPSIRYFFPHRTKKTGNGI